LRLLSTSLGAWDSISRDTAGEHGITFPLALVHAAIRAAGYPIPVCAEGPGAPSPGGRWDVILISALDSRHYWLVPDFLRRWGLAPLACDRKEGDPIVILGGQAAYNPAPIEQIADVVFVGEVEGGIGPVLAALDGRGRAAALERIAALPWCRVAAVQPTGHPIVARYAEDIGASLREHLQVNLRPIHRIEIARGCKGQSARASEKGTAACGFCSLGWRTPYRENSAADIGAALDGAGVTEIHLSAGDAEGHSEIGAIRATADRLGLRDHGWTGRLDTVDDCHVSAGKLFAVGLEGASWRLRRAVGKGRLTDDYVVGRIGEYWAAGGRRLMLHFIGGLPGECEADYGELDDLFGRLCRVAGRHQRPGVDVGRQPFGPLPHTPMQWFAPGLTTAGIGRVFDRWAQRPEWHLQHKSGQSYRAALSAAVAMRGGAEITPLLLAGMPRLPDGRGARRALGAALDRHGLDAEHYLSAWEIGSLTPWSNVRTYHGAHVARAARHIARAVNAA